MYYNIMTSNAIPFDGKRKKQSITLAALADLHQSHHRLNTRKGNLCMLRQIFAFVRHDVSIHEIDTLFCQRFADYLIKVVRPNSARTYLQKLHAMLHEAVRQGYLPYNPMPPLSDLLPKYAAPERCYLEKEEIRSLERTDCPHEDTKQAFLFACHTGLRLSDIETLRWSDIRRQQGRYIIVKIQVKTGREVRIPLDAVAESILARRKRLSDITHNDVVFHLKSRTIIARDLVVWAQAAGIEKHVTFHVARHSFATLLATQRNEIYVISQFLGHADVKTTQIYTKLVDSARFAAIESLNRLFGYPPRYSHPIRL